MNTFINKILILLLGLSINSGYDLKLKKDLVIDDDRVTSTSFDLEVQVDSEGQIFIANKDQNAIWLFTKDGSVKKKISRTGRGPGEFAHLGNLFLDQAGRLYGLDESLSKLAVFLPPSYTTVNEIIVKMVSGQSMKNIFVPDPDNFLITFSRYTTLQHPRQGRNWLYRINKNGAIQDTLFSFADDQMFVSRHGNRTSTLDVPFGYETLIAVDEKGNIYLGKTDESQIRIFNKYGSSMKKMTIRHKSIPVPPKALDKYRSFAYSNKQGSQIFKELLEAGVIPNVRPIYDWFEVDDKQQIWVAVNTKDPENYSVRIYNLKGELITKTELSKSVELKEVKDGYAYGVREGTNGLQSVIRYKIQGI